MHTSHVSTPATAQNRSTAIRQDRFDGIDFEYYEERAKKLRSEAIARMFRNWLAMLIKRRALDSAKSDANWIGG